MSTLQPFLFRLACGALLPLAGAACGVGAIKGAPVDTGAAWRQLQAEIGAARCDAPSQCKTLAVGDKACGGPERYVAFSSTASDPGRLARLAVQYTDASRRDNEREGLMSTCNIVPDPGATCQAGRCVLHPASAGATLQK
jgi:hypothetical protein